ncbi:MAG TPA: response regulator [Gaiellaceae bacterium]|nr:response regulator [Gaiellaceae bacterium]
MSDRILVIEDEEIVRGLIVEVLEDAGFEVVAAERAEAGLEVLSRSPISLVVSDIVMPGLTGLDLLARVRATHPSLPVVLVTGAGTYGNLTQALANGASGIVVKPFSHADLVAAVHSALGRARAAENDLRDRIVTPTVAAALANAIEARDVATHGHCERLAELALRIAEELELSPDDCETVRLGAVLHDVGKIAIPDRILLKPGPLAPEERALIQTHPVVGDRLLEPLAPLEEVRAAVRHHHERWDGTGYPDRLEGEAIPRTARIISVADAIEAMSATRPYRGPLDPERIVAELEAGRGTQWDPVPVDVALGLLGSGALTFPEGGLTLAAPPAAESNGAYSVLLVEDDADHAHLVAETIRRALDGAHVVHASHVAQAERLLADCSWSLAVLDHRLPDGNGLDLLRTVKSADPDVPVLVMTGEGSERLAVDAFRLGASDYVVKGENSMTELQARVRALLEAA